MKKIFLMIFLGLLGCTGNKQPSDPPKPAEDKKEAPGANNTKEAPLPPKEDTLTTSKGALTIVPIYHGTVLFQFGGKNIYVDPWSKGSYEGRPKADLILITDNHQDHFDPPAMDSLKTDKTTIIGPKVVAEKYGNVTVISNGETKEWEGIKIEAVPMYNIERGPEPGKLFHDKGRGNGYVITFGDKRIYLSGDTECTPEMKGLQNIDAAFVTMNLPYTMPPAEAATCIKAFRPKVVYPYHYRDSNLKDLENALATEKDIELRLRSWY